jgi:hypothetical protein
MPPLPTDLRSQLESTIIAARELAERAAAAALTTLAVRRDEAFPAMTDAQRRLRRALRQYARHLGEGVLTAGIDALIHEIAYEQWHRMLFARFLAENHLLMHPDGVAVTLDDCRELAREEDAADGWELAARYAGLMLPGLFAADDPTVQVRLAPEHRHGLEQRVQSLPAALFTASDSLGWVYQFWQSKAKKLVNQHGDKIGAATLGPVTQLFTEDYMVQFLLHNTLGAWWAARHPQSALVKEFIFLRGARTARRCPLPNSQFTIHNSQFFLSPSLPLSPSPISPSSTLSAAPAILSWRRSSCCCRCAWRRRGWMWLRPPRP